MTPLVSICIPTYNHGHFLSAAIQSALEQTEQDLEILVVDNCSTDDSETVVGRFCSLDERVRYVCNNKNLGLVGNLNRCLELARGTYIKYLLADDLLEPTCVSTMLQAYARSPEIRLVVSRRQLVDEQLATLRVAGFTGLHGLQDGKRMISQILFNGNYLGEPTATLFRRQDAIRGYSADFKRLVDVEMWFHLLENGQLFYVEDPLVQVRQHRGQETHGIINSLEFIDEEVLLYMRYINQPYVQSTPLNRLKWRFKTAWIYPFTQAWQADCRAVVRRVYSKLGADLLSPIFVARILASRFYHLLSNKS